MALMKQSKVDETTASPSREESLSVETPMQPDALTRISRISSVLSILVGGLALFSDGYNAQVIGYMNPIFAELFPNDFSDSIKTRLSNAFLIGEVFGMLFFGWAIDKLGRRTGIVWATTFLVLGIVLATASHGTNNVGMFWMMIIGRGVAGFGAGGKSMFWLVLLLLSASLTSFQTGEYPTCATSSAEAADDSVAIRRRRGALNAVATDFAIDFGFVIAGVVVLIVLAAYHQHLNDGVWRVSYGLGIIVPVGLIFLRQRLINSTQYRKHAIKKNIPYWLIIKRYWKPMVGTSLAWFLYDFVVGFTLSHSRAYGIANEIPRRTRLAFLVLPSLAH